MNKNNLLFLYLIIALMGCVSSGTQSPKEVASETAEESSLAQLFPFEYKRPSKPDAGKLAIVRYILKNTYENNIHKMRGETGNEVLVNQDGREAVYDKKGDLVTNSYNRGSFNLFFNETHPIKKFIGDITPWLQWGNAPDDPTTFEARLFYYTFDLNYGVQAYIFQGSQETLESVDFSSLSIEEKDVYYLFLYIIFNSEYSIQLEDKNIQLLRDDGDFYWEYFYQIHDLLGIRQ